MDGPYRRARRLRSKAMLVAVHTALWVETWGEDLAPHVERAAGLGFGGAEASLLGLDEPAAGRLATVADGCGIALRCTTGLSAAQDITSADPALRAAGIESLRVAADIVAAAGADTLTGVIYAPWGGASSESRADRLGRAADALGSVAARFGERGITLGIEAVNRFETDLVNTAAEALALALATGAVNVGVHLDTFHMNIEERSISAALVAAGDRLVHVHLVDNDRGAPGNGHIDWTDVFTGLAASGYDGWLGLELFVQAGLPVSPDLRIWRPIEADPTAAAVAGLAFVTRHLAA